MGPSSGTLKPGSAEKLPAPSLIQYPPSIISFPVSPPLLYFSPRRILISDLEDRRTALGTPFIVRHTHASLVGSARFCL